MKRKGLPLLLIITMLTMMLPTVVFGANNKAEEQHWGIEEMQAWQKKGLLTGYADGSLRPDAPVTRGEFARIINSVFHYVEMDSEGFSDVNASQWFYSDIGKAAAAGIIAGYPDGTFRPNEAISREDAAKIITAAFKLQPTADELSANLLAAYKDGSSAHPYAESALVKLIADGTIKGYPDGTIRPLKPVTRAESIALLSALTGTIIQTAETMKSVKIDGNLVINTPGVTLDNVTVKGNVYLTAGVGEGD
ncbi:MAG TPA: S-layer homology domain-containing protein, partial [Candidatus Paenibacillus intestinavium]|nr:S-layer homology domain-containing protein [Candidatus Paenibacillus intestinavium]